MKQRYATEKDEFIRVMGMKIRTRQTGKGRPLLLVNGMGACLEAWEPVIERLPNRHLIAVDHPGMGLSSPPNHVMSMTELADFYGQVLEALEVPRADILGFSFGGTVAQQMAKDCPEKVNSLILVGTAPGVGGFSPNPMTLMVAANPLRYQVPVVREMSAPIIYRGRVGRHPRLFEDELSGWDAHRATIIGVGCQVAAFSGWSSMPWLSSITVPTLVLAGEEDPMAPAPNSELIASLIPGAQLQIFPGAGHLCLFDLPDETVPVVTEFLEHTWKPQPDVVG